MSAKRGELKKTNPVKEEYHRALRGLCELLPDGGRQDREDIGNDPVNLPIFFLCSEPQATLSLAWV